MSRTLRGLILLLALVLSQGRPAFTLSCDPRDGADNAPATPVHPGHEGRPHGIPSSDGGPTPAQTCPAMLWCMTPAAPPAPGEVPVAAGLVTLTPLPLPLPPPDRTDAPANPPPKV